MTNEPLDLEGMRAKNAGNLTDITRHDMVVDLIAAIESRDREIEKLREDAAREKHNVTRRNYEIVYGVCRQGPEGGDK